MKYWKLFELWCVPFWKTCSEKNAFKILSSVWETSDTPQEKREIEQKFFCMKRFAWYSRRFKLNFKPKKTDFLTNLHWCYPLKKILCPITNFLRYFLVFHWEFYLVIYFVIYFVIKSWLIAKEKVKKISENITLSLNGKSSIH